ncbi:MAG: hypothetical protein ACRYGM_05865 [Janthinobacterium lividum]
MVSAAMAPTLMLPENPSPMPLAANSEPWITTVPVALPRTTSPVWSPVNNVLRSVSAPPVSSSPAAVPSVALAPANTKPLIVASVVTVSTAWPGARGARASSVTLPPTALSVTLLRMVAMSSV